MYIYLNPNCKMSKCNPKWKFGYSCSKLSMQSKYLTNCFVTWIEELIDFTNNSIFIWMQMNPSLQETEGRSSFKRSSTKKLANSQVETHVLFIFFVVLNLSLSLITVFLYALQIKFAVNNVLRQAQFHLEKQILL